MANIAGFCTKCGNPYQPGQAFCMSCGASLGTATVQPAAPAAPAPASAPAAAAPTHAPVISAPAKAKGSPVVKILLVLAVVFALFVGAGIAGVIYVGHRVKQKMESLGLNDENTSATRTANAAGANLCSLLSDAEVSQVMGAEVVRAEPPDDGNPGCTYSVKGDPADFTAKHASLMMAKNADKNAQATMENMGKAFFHGEESPGNGASPSGHPGEVPVLSFTVDTNGHAQAQMQLTEKMMGALGPMASRMIPGVGDEAFDAGGALMMVRKGNKLARIMYMMCPCTTDDVVPLARKIADGM
jgi:zinc-ribbon domain